MKCLRATTLAGRTALVRADQRMAAFLNARQSSVRLGGGEAVRATAAARVVPVFKHPTLNQWYWPLVKPVVQRAAIALLAEQIADRKARGTATAEDLSIEALLTEVDLPAGWRAAATP